VFKGTRLPVATVIENLEDLSIDEVIEQFDVTREQVTAGLDFVAQSLCADPVPIGDRRIRYQQNLGVRRINCPRAIPPPAPRAR